MSSAAANKEVIGLVATEGIKELVILFEQTAGKAIVEGDIEQLKPEHKDIFYINWSVLKEFPQFAKNRVTTLEKLRYFFFHIYLAP